MPRPAVEPGAAERAVNDGCPHCTKQPFRFSQAVALGLYRGLLREAVIAAKQSAHLPLAVSLARLTAERVAVQLDRCRPEVVTAVPSYWRRRLRRRGTPAEALAETIAAELNIRHCTLLKCTRATEKQGTLSPERRKTNVRGAFAAKTGYAFGTSPWSGRGRHVLLIDDVLTTGATADAAAAALLGGGAVRVSLAVIARAVG